MNREEMRAAILASDDLAREPVDVPWPLDEKLYVRALQAGEKDSYVALTMQTGDFQWSGNVTAALLVKVIVNENGERIFTDADIPALGLKDAGTLSKLFRTALRLSGMGSGDAEKIQADFGLAQSDGSGSG
jgi:hypothetical protein